MISIFMRDNPLPGVPFNTPEGIQAYKSAMGLPVDDDQIVLDDVPNLPGFDPVLNQVPVAQPTV